MPDEKPTTEIVTLHAAGAIPGIAGQLGPGSYTVDWEARTATPVAETNAEPEPVEKTAKKTSTSEPTK